MTTTKTATLEQLGDAVRDCDKLTQGATHRMAALCTAALALLRGRNANADEMQSARGVLQLVLDELADLENEINAAAEGCGCHYTGGRDGWGASLPGVNAGEAQHAAH